MKKVHKAVIPAAGWGTRCLPASKAIPKEMMPIVDKPAIQYVVEEAVAAGITDILIVTGRDKESIEDHFDRNFELETYFEIKGKRELVEKIRQPSTMANIYYIRQKEKKGLGHAISCAREFIGHEPFAVLLPDDLIQANVPCLKQMVDEYEKRPGTTVAVIEVAKEDIENYGIIKPERLTSNVYVIKDLVEKPLITQAPSNLAIVGRYIIEPEIFDLLEHVEPGVGGEIQLTDALRLMASQTMMYGYKFYGTRFDVGHIPGFIRANIQFGLDHQEYGALVEREIEAVLNNKVKIS